MKWCRYSHQGAIFFGQIKDDSVIRVDGTPWGDHKVTGEIVPLKSLKLELPVIPSTFFCVGVNYRDHVERMAAKRGTKPSYPPRPDIGYRANNALIAHDENIVKPRDASDAFQYEGELVGGLRPGVAPRAAARPGGGPARRRAGPRLCRVASSGARRRAGGGGGAPPGQANDRTLW